ncbi:hypothetical protein GCM10022253_01600 [Sphingomonas endophytica]|uniref:Lipoprotein n=1 Tax=Sphingomonas endophytica TaxID=869719 RepID=A0ABR6N3E0_9SPHN|nr:hypothetical protein [Sphingomonas endophytica]MBB5725310.1 hypothetical protein [Sphingomonas endophytica]
MRHRSIMLAACGMLMLGACAKKAPPAPPPPPPPGAVAGSHAADRDGDGIVDGYYTSDGIYHPYAPPAPPPPPAPTRRGERG